MLLDIRKPVREESPRRARARLLACLALALVSSCTHKPNAAGQISGALQPFTSTRNQAVALVAGQKRALGPEDLNTLAVLYSTLEGKANAYAGFIVEGVTAASFDDQRNQRYADDLSHGIAVFNHGFAQMSGSKRDVLSAAWIGEFAGSLHAKWSQYQPMESHLSAQQSLDLVAQIKRDTVWPNFEDVATEAVH